MKRMLGKSLEWQVERVVNWYEVEFCIAIMGKTTWIIGWNDDYNKRLTAMWSDE